MICSMVSDSLSFFLPPPNNSKQEFQMVEITFKLNQLIQSVCLSNSPFLSGEDTTQMGKTDVQRRYAKQFEMAEGFSFLLFLIYCPWKWIIDLRRKQKFLFAELNGLLSGDLNFAKCWKKDYCIPLTVLLFEPKGGQCAVLCFPKEPQRSSLSLCCLLINDTSQPRFNFKQFQPVSVGDTQRIAGLFHAGIMES